MKKNGFSLIELLVVMIILGIVASLGTVSFRGWIRKTELESQVKEMYTDIMNARLTAMHRNTTHLISLSANKIEASVDTNGNWEKDAGENALCIWNRNKGDAADANCPNDKSLSYKNLTFPATWIYPASNKLVFNPRGLYVPPNLAEPIKTICVIPTHNSSFNCIVISSTRIRMGKLINQSGECNDTNCEAKK